MVCRVVDLAAPFLPNRQNISPCNHQRHAIIPSRSHWLYPWHGERQILDRRNVLPSPDQAQEAALIYLVNVLQLHRGTLGQVITYGLRFATKESSPEPDVVWRADAIDLRLEICGNEGEEEDVDLCSQCLDLLSEPCCLSQADTYGTMH